MQILKDRTFKWWEIGLIKVCLISLGILLGIYFFDYLASLFVLWWALFMITAVYFILKIFKE